MKRSLELATLFVLFASIVEGLPAAEGPTDGFTPLALLPAPTIVASSEAYPGGRYEAANLIDGNPATEYSSRSKGTETSVDFDFGGPTLLAAIAHVDRNDPATIASSTLVLANTADFSRPVGRVTVAHANTRGGTTFARFAPTTARYVRWQVTSLGPQGYGTVGGAEIKFYMAEPKEKIPTRIQVRLIADPAVLANNGVPVQPLRAVVEYPYAEPTNATLRVSDLPPKVVPLRFGTQTVESFVPAGDVRKPCHAALEIDDRTVAHTEVVIEPARRWVLYLLPHSHVDIGYTHVQTEIEKKQWSFLEQAIELARRTADYPPEARFKWNSEVLWAVDSYLSQATPERRAAAIEAIKRGWIHLDALYGNELTGLCRPEELFRLTDCARRLSEQYGLSIDAAMISDVPGCAWGIVPALAHSGIKYFSIGPNHCHRIGHALAAWGDRPFYWRSPSGQERVLCWMAGKGYSWFHPGRLGAIRQVQPGQFFAYLAELMAADYPYDMVQIRQCVGGDNGPPDADLPDFVRQWNETYVWPKLVITTTSQMFREFENRYGQNVPEVRGDFTPYWEDGAGSSALETALARTASERLTTAEALWAMLKPNEYPVEDFYQAWRNVLLYNEHTWGASGSITQPDSQMTRGQWRIKSAFAQDADSQSRRLVAAALLGLAADAARADAVDVYNTASWPRTDLVVLPKDFLLSSQSVKDADGRPVRSQRLATGQLAFLAVDVPPLSAKRFLFEPGETSTEGQAAAHGATLVSGPLRVTLDDRSGAIAGLANGQSAKNLVRTDVGMGLNDYVYVAGRDPRNQKRSGSATIAVQDAGPLVASLRVESEAPGCRRLVRQYRVVDGLDFVEMVQAVDKAPVRDKEGVHFGFACDVPHGVMRMDIPWAVIRPEVDQLPGSCKNYFSVGRWVDVSNAECGVTWATLDAPLVEVGAIEMDVASPFDPDGFLKAVTPSQTFYSYAMNNYWETNYKADQEGMIPFRYALRPHGPFDAASAARFGIERSQPLVPVPVARDAPLGGSSVIRVEPESVIVSLLKPTHDGKGLLIRLFNTTDKATQATLAWPRAAPRRITLSSPFERPGVEVRGTIDLPGYGIASLRAELED